MVHASRGSVHLSYPGVVLQYDFLKPALSLCGSLPVIGAVGITPSVMFVAHHLQLIEQPWLHQRHG